MKKKIELNNKQPPDSQIATFDAYAALSMPLNRCAKDLLEFISDHFDSKSWSKVSDAQKTKVLNSIQLFEQINKDPNHTSLEQRPVKNIEKFRASILAPSLHTSKGSFFDSVNGENLTEKTQNPKVRKNLELAMPKSQTTNTFKRTASDKRTDNILSNDIILQKIKSRFRSQNQFRQIVIEFAQDLGLETINLLKSNFEEKHAELIQLEDKKFKIKFKGEDRNRFTRKNGYIQSIFTRLALDIKYTTISDPMEFEETGPNRLSQSVTLFMQLLKIGNFPAAEIQRFILRSIDKKDDIPLARKAIRKLKARTKYKSQKKSHRFNQKSIYTLDNENLFKEESSIDNKPMLFYYSNDVIKFIRNGNFDSIFIDSTHLKMLRKHQITIVRFYSSSAKKILTAMYIVNPSKKSKAYSEIFRMLNTLNLLTNCKRLMTDFELAIKKGYEDLALKPLKFRFCFFHLLSACRKYASSVNKTIFLENHLKNKRHAPTTPNIFRFFVFLIFIKQSHQKLLFQVFKFFFRSTVKSLANELFMNYFWRTYIKGPFSSHFYLDLNDSLIITNNFVEGVNSSMKRHNRGRVNLETFYDWMSLDIKTIIMNLNTNSIRKSVMNPKFEEFAKAFVAQQNWVDILFNYIEECVKQQKFRNNESRAGINQSDYELLKKRIKNSKIVVDEDRIGVYQKRRQVYVASDDFENDQQDIDYWKSIEPEFELYFKRVKYK